MDIEQLIEGYIKEYGEKYKTNISHFQRYLKEIGKTDRLNAITIEDVNNYVRNGKSKRIILTSNTMESVVYNQFKQELQETYDLKEEVPRGISNDKEIERILEAFKRYFIETKYDDIVGKQAKDNTKDI